MYALDHRRCRSADVSHRVASIVHHALCGESAYLRRLGSTGDQKPLESSLLAMFWIWLLRGKTAVCRGVYLNRVASLFLSTGKHPVRWLHSCHGSIFEGGLLCLGRAATVQTYHPTKNFRFFSFLSPVFGEQPPKHAVD